MRLDLSSHPSTPLGLSASSFRLTAEQRRELVPRLMELFVRHQMAAQVQSLQAYLCATCHSDRRPWNWNDSTLIRWAAIFRLPPYQDVLPIRSASATCEECSAVNTQSVKLPDGRAIRCHGCGDEWLVLDS